MTKQLKKIISTIVVTVSLNSSPASAMVVSTPVMEALATVQAGMDAAIAGATGVMAATGLTQLLETMKGNMAAKSAAMQTSTSINEAARMQTQAATTAQAEKDIADVKRKSDEQITDVCGKLAATETADATSDVENKAAARYGSGSQGGGARSNKGPVSGGAQQLNRYLDIQSGKSPESVPPPEVKNALAGSGLCGAFASSGSVRGRLCDNAGFKPSSNPVYEDADQKAATIIFGPQKTGSGVKGGSIKQFGIDEADANQMLAVDAYRSSLSRSGGFKELTKYEAQSTQGKAFLGLLHQFEARSDLGRFVYEQQAQMRTKEKSLTDAVKAMLASDKENNSTYIKDKLAIYAKDWESKGIDADSFIKLDVDRYYDNPAWIKNLSSLSDKAPTEQVRLTAMNNSLLFKLYEQVRMSNLLLAQVVQSNVNVEMRDEMRRLHNSATTK